MTHANRSTKLRSYPATGTYEVWFCDQSGKPVRNNRTLGSHLLSGARWTCEEHAQAAIDDAYDNYERKQAKKAGLPQGSYATRCRDLLIPATVPAPRGRLAVVKIAG